MQNISAKYPDNSFSNVRVFGEVVFGDPEPSSYYIRWAGPSGGYGSFMVNCVIPNGENMSSYYSNLADYSGRYTNFNGELRNDLFDYNDHGSTRCKTDFYNAYISRFETNAYYTEFSIGNCNRVVWVDSVPSGYYYGNYLPVNTRLKNAYLYRTRYIGPEAFTNCVCLSNIIMSKVVSIGSKAFQSCWAFPSSLYLSKCKYVGDYAFFLCRDKTPDAVIYYGTYGYRDLNGFYDTVISSVIGSSYYPDRYGTMSVMLPVCEYIGSYAFFDCNLSYLDAGNCSFLGKNAFGPFGPIPRGSSFTLILRGSSVCQNGGSQLGWPLDVTSTSIYVPSSLVSDYKSAYEWRRLSSVIYPIPSSMTS